jgi:uncharacterized membrane protein HdeD (DUF308 family)
MSPMNWRDCRPAVPRTWLVALAGLVWCSVGVMLCVHAFDWLRELHDLLELPLGIVGIVLGILAYMLMFSRIAKKNIARIGSFPVRVCVFAFQGLRGYVIIGFMIALGALLRHSAIPRHYLAVIYLAIGTALVMSSVLLYRTFFALRSDRE